MPSQAPLHLIVANGPHISVAELLARSLNRDGVTLTKDARGRPGIGGETDISYSHSGDYLALAWSDVHRVGVDIERVRERRDWMGVAGRFFAESEKIDLQTHGSLLAFLQLWCLKEAVLKAHGHGISYGLHKPVFRFRDGGWAIRDIPEAMGSNWHAQLLDAPVGYVAALAWCDRKISA